MATSFWGEPLWDGDREAEEYMRGTSGEFSDEYARLGLSAIQLCRIQSPPYAIRSTDWRAAASSAKTNPSSERARIDKRQALIQRTWQPSCLAVCERSGYSTIQHRAFGLAHSLPISAPPGTSKSFTAGISVLSDH